MDRIVASLPFDLNVGIPDLDPPSDGPANPANSHLSRFPRHCPHRPPRAAVCPPARAYHSVKPLPALRHEIEGELALVIRRCPQCNKWGTYGTGICQGIY